MEVGHEGAGGCHVFHDGGGEKVRLYGGDAIAFHSLHFIKGLDEVEERLSALSAELTHVYSGEHYFSGAGCRSLPCLRDAIGHGGGAGTSAGHGYGAVGAPVVASVLHLEPEAGALASSACGHECAYALEVVHLHGALLLAGHHLLYERDHLSLLSLPEHEAHSGQLRYLGGLELGVASGDHYAGAGMTAVEHAYELTPFLVGRLCDGAGVHETQVRFLARLCAHPALVGQHACKCGGFGEIEFAAKSVERHPVLECTGIHRVTIRVRRPLP